MNNELFFSSKTNEWDTPQDFYNKLNEEFNFTLDPCTKGAEFVDTVKFTENSTYQTVNLNSNNYYVPVRFRSVKGNAKCDKFFTEEDNGLEQDWGGETVFCNPPYGRAIKDWVKKSHDEAQKPNTTVVMLIPARTDTSYFHDYIYHNSKEIRFVRGRLKFGGVDTPAPFPSMVVVF